MATPEEWYRSLPPVTRGYMTSAVAATLTVQLGLLDPSLMHLDFPSIFGSLELWRLLTNFTFFGTFSFPFVMSLFFLIRYTKELEAKRFEGRTADFLWAMAIMGAVQAVVAYVLGGLPFLSQAMLSAIVYVWSREFADTVLSVFGLFNVQAPLRPHHRPPGTARPAPPSAAQCRRPAPPRAPPRSTPPPRRRASTGRGCSSRCASSWAALQSSTWSASCLATSTTSSRTCRRRPHPHLHHNASPPYSRPAPAPLPPRSHTTPHHTRRHTPPPPTRARTP